MKKIKTELEGVYIIEPSIFGDNRGWFYESYNKEAFEKIGIDACFVQDNRSFSEKKGTIRGLHRQKAEHSQAKLVSCQRGEIYDIVVDARKNSPTYLKHIKVKLSGENKKMLFIPKGCLHGFVTLTDNVELFYKCDELYCKDSEETVRFDSPAFNIDWEVENPILSQKDLQAPYFTA